MEMEFCSEPGCRLFLQPCSGTVFFSPDNVWLISHKRDRGSAKSNCNGSEEMHSVMFFFLSELDQDHGLQVCTLVARGVASGGKRVTECIGPRGLGARDRLAIGSTGTFH